MGGYSEACPVCGKGFNGPGIGDHVKNAHADMYEFWHNERYGGKPGTGVKKRYFSGPVENYGQESEIATDPQ